jgi:hypothetical protein
VWISSHCHVLLIRHYADGELVVVAHRQNQTWGLTRVKKITRLSQGTCQWVDFQSLPHPSNSARHGMRAGSCDTLAEPNMTSPWLARRLLQCFTQCSPRQSQPPHTGTRRTLSSVMSQQSMSGSTRAFFPFRSRFHPRCKRYNITSVKCCWCDNLLGMETKLASLLFAWIEIGELLQLKSRPVFCLYCLYLCLFPFRVNWYT